MEEDLRQLKNYYRQNFVRDIAVHISENYSKFKSDDFVSDVLNDDWASYELKHRMQHISMNIYKYLPDDYEQVLDILWYIPDKLVGYEMSGFLLMCFPDIVEKYGMDDWELSMKALAHFTKTSSSEFAVRPFILKNKDKMLNQMIEWSYSDNYHVRRLSSEGCRPRLPWSFALTDFKKDPTLIIPILENLKEDKSEYVRKSVANNLNDISKDNPDIVIDIAKKWYGNNKNTDRIVKHGCRTMLKKSMADVLDIFGYCKILPASAAVGIPNVVKIGSDVDINIDMSFDDIAVSNLRIEYAVYYPRKNGQLSKKIFQVSERGVIKPSISIVKRHSFKQMSTRTHYAGDCRIDLIINGQVCTFVDFKLI